MRKPEEHPSRLAQVRRLFEVAMDLPDAEREAFVRREAGDDRALIEEVLALCSEAGGVPTDALREAVQIGGAAPRASAPVDRDDSVRPTATDELLGRLAQAPRLDTDRYRLEGTVGHGGMGEVLRIHDRHLHRRLAMKVLLEREVLDAEDQQLARQVLGRFLEEAQVTSQLDHPGVVPVHELGLDQDGKVYFTMRLVKGKTAGEVFALARSGQDGWTTTRALEVLLKVCDTMAFAHDKGVLHRDLKPANVMVGRFGEVYVMDWGLAKLLGAEAPATDSSETDTQLETARRRDVAGDGASLATLPNQKPGTPSYMAPEQAAGAVLDVRVDVYAIGAMLYELLAGRAPYVEPGQRQGPFEILAQVRNGPPKRIEDLDRTVPAELVAITERAMARSVADRYPTVAALAADLRAFLDQRAVQAYRTGALVELKLWVRRNQPLAASLAAAVLLLAVGIAVTSWLARENAALVVTTVAQKERADAKVREFDLLSGVVLYERAIAGEADLYPAWPNKVEAMQRWLREDAGRVLAMQPEIEQTVRDLEARALPPTAEEQDADRRSHPKFAAWEALTQRVASLRHAQSIRDGAPLVVPELLPGQQALDASALNSLAWPRVAPKAEERTVHGEEPLGLVAARLAVQKAKDTELEFQVYDTLAWALLANGRDAEARRASEVALDLAPAEQKEAYQGYLRDVTAATADTAAALAAAERQLAELTTAVNQRRTFRFELESQRFLHDTLVELLGKLGSLAAKEKAAVDQRLWWAQRIQQLSLAHPNARHTWAAVRAAIAANAKYAGQTIELREQDITGLVPIGENPVTHLWEFYELRSAWDGTSDPATIPIPEHKADGSIEVMGDTGIVFVLLPGGNVTLGSQDIDANAPFFDAQHSEWERLHVVTLSSFFLARHEMTQGQWSRLWTWDAELRDPSNYKAGQRGGGKLIRLTNPVEQVNWPMSDQLLTRHGMALPTEAQWEYGCRGGTTTQWNVAFEELRKVANLADLDAKDAIPQWGNFESWRDGHVLHAAVGTFAANSFGLFDVHGNVWEWCRDPYGEYGSERNGDGLRQMVTSPFYPGRGGSFNATAWSARSSYRLHNAPSLRFSGFGLRPARLLPP